MDNRRLGVPCGRAGAHPIRSRRGSRTTGDLRTTKIVKRVRHGGTDYDRSRASPLNADRIFVVDEGGIAQQGSHRDLLAAGGLYRNLNDRQFADLPRDRLAGEAETERHVLLA